MQSENPTLKSHWAVALLAAVVLMVLIYLACHAERRYGIVGLAMLAGLWLAYTDELCMRLWRGYKARKADLLTGTELV